jgi:tight adherence protein C
MSIHSILIPLLAMIAVTATGGAVLAWIRSRHIASTVRLRIGEGGQAMEVAETSRDYGVSRSIERAASAVSWGKPTPKLRQQLARAGFHAPNAGSVFLGLKTLIFFTTVTGLTAVLVPLGFSTLNTFGIVFAGAALLSFIPNIVVSARRGGRSAEMKRHLPDALDLLEICVSSGMGLDTAWNSVADEVRGVSPALADEMALTSLQLRLGGSRSIAMKNMAERTGVDEIGSLVAVLVQSERFGTSISDALRAFAGAMRERRSQNAAEAAEKTAVKLLFPMVLFIFPAVFVVTVGPAAVQLYKLISGQM